MALTVMVGLNALTTIGLDRMIVAGQFKSQTEFNDHLNTVWSAELVRSLFLTLLLLLVCLSDGEILRPAKARRFDWNPLSDAVD